MTTADAGNRGTSLKGRGAGPCAVEAGGKKVDGSRLPGARSRRPASTGVERPSTWERHTGTKSFDASPLCGSEGRGTSSGIRPRGRPGGPSTSALASSMSRPPGSIVHRLAQIVRKQPPPVSDPDAFAQCWGPTIGRGRRPNRRRAKWTGRDLNPRPPVCKTGDLPS